MEIIHNVFIYYVIRSSFKIEHSSKILNSQNVEMCVCHMISNSFCLQIWSKSGCNIWKT